MNIMGGKSPKKSTDAARSRQRFFLTFSIITVAIIIMAVYLLHRATLFNVLSELLVLVLLLIGAVYSNPQNYPNLHVYLDFLIGEIPNILQILTFAAFMVAFFKKDGVGSTLTIVALVLTLNNLYLNNKQRRFIHALTPESEKRNHLKFKFLLFNQVLVTRITKLTPSGNQGVPAHSA